MTRKNGKANSDNLPEVSTFVWDRPRVVAATMLAEGYTQEETATEIGVTSRTIRNWKDREEFAAEVDRLSLMIDIASRAERLRIAKRIVREKGYTSDRDLLDWLKFAQSETDGVKLDLSKLASAFGADAPPVADTRQNRIGANGAGEATDD